MPKPDLIVRGAIWEDSPRDLVVAKGKILELLPYDEKRSFEARIIDAHELLLLPSFIDAHTHLREPGYEYKENIASGLGAAAHGGFGHIMCMANTKPVNDHGPITTFMRDQAKKAWAHGPHLHPIGALTKGLAGKELAPLAELAEAGCIAFSNDGLPVASTETFRRAMEYASGLGKVVIDHCEDPAMAPAAGINEGILSGNLGLKGQPTVAESAQVARDILLSLYLQLPVHLAHISCRESVELIAWGKAKGAQVTAETCPHYLIWTEDIVLDYNTMAKVSPPIRSADDQLALLQGLREGVIDILATDHAPHAADEKEQTFEDAPCGISGLDSALFTTWGLVTDKTIDRDTFLRAWCHKPGEIFGLATNHFQPGDPADFFLFDSNNTHIFDADSMHSLGKNTPLLGSKVTGRVQAHFIGGRNVI